MKDFQFSLLEWSILLFTEEIRLDVPSGYHENVKDATHLRERDPNKALRTMVVNKKALFLGG